MTRVASSPILTIGRPVGAGLPPFVIAELSANHYATNDIAPGEELTRGNVRSIRPGFGLPPRELLAALGKHARVTIVCGAPLAWELIR
jgi:sialic acid synthase SpsE